uniref:non-specific serine/threonine protein kinase n=1 Tax=Opuntia streptacantha TaxID=393608 RepID=A0A7C8YK90_OPUST
MEMGCCGCFGFSRRFKVTTNSRFAMGSLASRLSQQHLLGYDDFYDVVATDIIPGSECETPSSVKRSEEVLRLRLQSGLICRQHEVKETNRLVRSEDENGNKKINEYVRVCKIGAGSYGKVVLYESSLDGKNYAIKAFHKSHLLKQRVSSSETAMTDVLREVLIMKTLSHPNIVNLIEVIDDPNTDNFYMVLEYIEGKWDCEGSGPSGGVGEATARKYLRDIVSGLIYLHAHNIVHLDIKPQNLLVSRDGNVKIADFSVSQAFEGDNDELRRSPGTPVITAPECCLGLTYQGKAADTWAVGITLYYMVMGCFPFMGETLQDQYDKIVNDPLRLPDDLNPQLRNLLEGLLCKDPKQRMTLDAVAEHPWVVGEDGPLPEFLCWCKRNSSQRNELELNKKVLE